LLLIIIIVLNYIDNISCLKEKLSKYKEDEDKSLSANSNISNNKQKLNSIIIESKPGKTSFITLRPKSSYLGYSFGMSSNQFIFLILLIKTYW